jgi:hypothetical protein
LTKNLRSFGNFVSLYMAIQFITNDKSERTAAIIPISEYENLLHQHHLSLELTDDYKQMMDKMIDAEDSGNAHYVSYQNIKDRFSRT